MRGFLFGFALLLLLAGGAISAGMIGYERTETVAKLGPMELTNTERKAPPVELGYGLLAVGAVVFVIALIRKK